MFTSTDIRQKGVTDFLTAYQQNCALNGSIPIKPILNGIGGTALFIDISKVFSGGLTYGKIHYRWLKHNTNDKVRLTKFLSCKRYE